MNPHPSENAARACLGYARRQTCIEWTDQSPDRLNVWLATFRHHSGFIQIEQLSFSKIADMIFFTSVWLDEPGTY